MNLPTSFRDSIKKQIKRGRTVLRYMPFEDVVRVKTWTLDPAGQRYGRYTAEPTMAQLHQYFHFDQTDRSHIARRRHPHNRLGSAIQLGAVRFLGTFLSDPTDVPKNVVRYVARQRLIADLSCLSRHRTSEQRWSTPLTSGVSMAIKIF